jgi:hypothetical protein
MAASAAQLKYHEDEVQRKLNKFAAELVSARPFSVYYQCNECSKKKDEYELEDVTSEFVKYTVPVCGKICLDGSQEILIIERPATQQLQQPAQAVNAKEADEAEVVQMEESPYGAKVSFHDAADDSAEGSLTYDCSFLSRP